MKKEAMDGLFLTIFHGERSELREKYGLDIDRRGRKLLDQVRSRSPLPARSLRNT